MNSVPMANNKQIAKIHTLAGRAGLEGDTYRGFLERETGKRSSKDCTGAEAGRVIDKLAVLAGQSRRAKSAAAGAVAGLDTPVGAKLRALWIAGHDLGVVQERGDQAMLSFLHRQTGMSHVRFLGHPGSTASAIEALKAWLARDAKVEWPSDTSDVKATKHAVVNAQWLALVEIGAVKPFRDDHPLDDLDAYAAKLTWKHGWVFYEAADYDKVQGALGRKLRKAIEERDAKAGA